MTEETRADRLRGYLIALERFPVPIVDEAMRRILQGTAEVDGERLNARFMPTPPQLARLCNDTQAELYRATKPRLVYERPKPEPEPEISDEERERRAARVREALAKLTGNLA